MRISPAIVHRPSSLCIAMVSIMLVSAGTALAGPDLEKLAKQAVSSDREQADAAIDALRKAGPEGLAALFEVHKAQIDQHAAQRRVVASLEELRSRKPAKNLQQQASAWPRISRAIDEVAAQKDAHAAGLYWHTDWDRAVAAAKERNKPILSLRLLGHLDRDRSCANSRFFRTALYPDAEVKRQLSEHFVLHWQSLRPVPHITIDMGDGRRIERTITGNSVHYVLDSDGRVIDVMPGMYAPDTFVEILDVARLVHGRELSDEQLASHHEEMAKRLASQWTQALARHGIEEARAALPDGGQPMRRDFSIYASRANELAPSKAAVARPLFTALGDDRLQAMTDDDMWSKLAKDFRDAARLDDASRELIEQKAGDRFDAIGAVDADRRAISKSFVESPMLRLVREFEQSIARDTAMNEYRHHRRIYTWLAEKGPSVEVAKLNERIYADLFEAPLDDPWMGLVPDNAYSALDNGGLVTQ